VSSWPQVTCTECGATGPGRAGPGLCRRCYARSRHPVQPCEACGRTRRHLAAGLCARCYRCGRQQPIGAAGECRSCQLAAQAARKRAREAPRRWPPRPAAAPDPRAGYGQAHGWRPDTVRRVRRAVAAVTASGGQLGEPPWDDARLRQFLIQDKLAVQRTLEFLGQ
jgi:hypothetical protein